MSEPLDLKKLSEPFPPDEIEWRVGSTTKDKSRGLALAYITSRHVMDRLDEVCGPEGWQCRYMETAKGRMLCTISIKVGSDWVEKSDGAGDTDVEGDKGAISDALKRAAVPWGIGRYLYNLESPWVELENNKIKGSELNKLQMILKRQLGGTGEVKEPPKPVDKGRTVAQLKGEYALLKEEMSQESAGGYAKLIRWVNDPDVLKSIARLERYADDFRREFKEVAALAKAAEYEFGQPIQVSTRGLLPSFDHLDSSSSVGDILESMPNE